MDERAAKLLLKAVRSLPQREQDQVLAGLIGGVFAQPASFGRPASPDVVMLSQGVPVAPTIGAPVQSTMLPVRLPPELHERLRSWSTEKGFSMAGVVRGLVERFLDEQSGKVVPRTRPAGTRSKRSTTARG